MTGIVPAPRAAGAPHIPILEALHRAIFTEPWDRPWIARDFADILAMKRAGAWISVENEPQGAPNGFAMLLVADQAELLLMGVLPESRRQGYGRRLLDRVCEEAARQGATRIFLEHAASNAEAASFYARAGFLAQGWRKDYYRLAGHCQDALILVKNLT